MVRWPSWLWRQVKVTLTLFLVTKVAWVRVPLSSAFVWLQSDTPGSFFGYLLILFGLVVEFVLRLSLGERRFFTQNNMIYTSI
jgi:hypothetical protein